MVVAAVERVAQRSRFTCGVHLRKPSRHVQVWLHFVTFVHVDGSLYELDGRKHAAIKHGATTPATLLQDTCAVVKKYVEATNSIRFNLIALAPA